MSVAATSIYAIPRQTLREQLAALASVQTFLDVDDAAEAIDEAKMPDEMVLDPELKTKHPFIVVGDEGVFLTIVRMDENHHHPINRKMSVRLLMDAVDLSIDSTGIVGSVRDNVTTFQNHIGDIMEQLADSSHTVTDGTALVFGNLELKQKPIFNPTTDWATGVYMWAEFTVEIDPLQGGG